MMFLQIRLPICAIDNIRRYRAPADAVAPGENIKTTSTKRSNVAAMFDASEGIAYGDFSCFPLTSIKELYGSYN